MQMFKSRRKPPPPPETAKVADVVQAYYDAGRRPANNRFASPPVSEPETAVAEPETPVAEPEAVHETAQEAVEDAVEPVVAAGPILVKAEAPPVRKSLGVLADELEAFIEAIRYGDNLGGTEVLSGAVAR